MGNLAQREPGSPSPQSVPRVQPPTTHRAELSLRAPSAEINSRPQENWAPHLGRLALDLKISIGFQLAIAWSPSFPCLGQMTFTVLCGCDG